VNVSAGVNPARNLSASWGLLLVYGAMSQLAEQMTSIFPTLLLWGGASLLAIMLLAKSMIRRRDLLTESLKKHVADNLNAAEKPPPEKSSEDAEANA
jgi:hypothetical protein